MDRFYVASLIFAGIPHALGTSCSDQSSCGSCLDQSFITGCEWCAVDWRCYDVGALESPCLAPPNDYRCYSKAEDTTCDTAICPDNSTSVRPHQLRIAFAGTAGMRIAWKTILNPLSCYVAVKSSGPIPRNVPLEGSIQYLKSHGYHHWATIRGLKTASEYTYTITCDGASSSPRTFKTETNDPYVNIIVMGDMGTKSWGNAMASKARIDALLSDANFTLHVGDHSYADDAGLLHPSCFAFFCYEAILDQYFEWFEDVVDTKAHMIAVGNHDMECHDANCLAESYKRNALRNFSAFNARWRMPSAESGGVASMWYSYDYGPAHFVVLNTETDFPGAADQFHGSESGILACGNFAPNGTYLRWLDADLAAASKNRAERPWIVVYGHRNWMWLKGAVKTDYTSSMLRSAHQHLFLKYDVDLHLAGHIHGYYSDVPQPGTKGTPFVCSGAAGCDEGLHTDWTEESGIANGFKYHDRGYPAQVGTLEITRTKLTWKGIDSASGQVYDNFTLVKTSFEVEV